MWCSKIYEIFNGWTEEDPNFPIDESISAVQFREQRQITEKDNSEPVIQHDSPFLPKPDSLSLNNDRRTVIFNSDLSNRDYRDEHFSTDRFFSCHQRDGLYNSNRSEGALAIATISHMSLNLPKTMGNVEDKYEKAIARGFSLDLSNEHSPSDYSNFTTPTDEQTSLRYSLNKMKNNGESLPDLSGCRISTRSSVSVYGYDSPEFSHRNSEQIAREVQFSVHEMLKTNGDEPLPMIFRFSTDEEDFYRVEGSYRPWQNLTFVSKIPDEQIRIETENIAAIYSNSFLDQDHRNLFGIDRNSNPVVISVKRNDDHLAAIVRTKNGSKFETIDDLDAEHDVLLKKAFPEIEVDRLEICEDPSSRKLIQDYDEKFEIKKFKFAVIYQRRGQTSEEEFFNNERHGPAFTEFLETIATRVSLKNFKGYRAGLDVSEQTDSPESYYEIFDGKEIMFHVSTLLPFSLNDSTQIQRKRHIGNDIVGIVFQEENTPFHPSMIKSNFLHVFLVVQPAKVLSQNFYKIMLVARHDVPNFGPALGSNIAFIRTAENLKQFILTKLINAEYAAYRCQTFSSLQERTRCSFLKNLCENMSEKTFGNEDDDSRRSSHRRSSIFLNFNRRSYFSSVKNLFTRSNTLPETERRSVKAEKSRSRTSKKLSRSGKTIDIDPSSNFDPTLERDKFDRQRADSLNSSEDQRSSIIQQDSSEIVRTSQADDSDEGLDSMSSADATKLPYDSDEKDVYRRNFQEKSHAIQNRERFSFQQVRPIIHQTTEATTV